MAKTYTKTQVEVTEAMLLISKADRILANNRAHVFFQLSSPDAQQIAVALDGGKTLAERLKNLPRRHMVIKTGYERRMEGVVPLLNCSKADFSDLYDRCRTRWPRKRSEVEQEIAKRQKILEQTNTATLNDWE